MRMLDGNADGDLAGSRFVERIAVGIAALIDCGAGSVANTGQHRVLASELEIRLVIGIYDRMRCLGERYDLHGTGLRLREANLHAAGVVGGGFRIAPADIDRHHFIRYTLVVGHGPDIAAQLVVRHPDMPAPHDTAVRVTHGHDSVALLDRRLRHVEGQAVLVGRKPDIRHQIFLVLPNEYGIQGRTPRIVIDIGIGDSRIEMVYEGLQYGCFAGLRSVGRSVRTAVLDSVTIDQRQGVLSRGVDDVTAVREIMERNDRKALDEWIHRQRSSWAVIRADKPLWNLYELLHQESECSEMELRKCVDAMLRMGTVIIELAQKERRSSDESICD